MNCLIEEKYLPEKFKYPFAIYKLSELNLIDFDIWYFMDSEYALRRMYELENRYKRRKLVPFAMRSDNDDIACFDLINDNKIVIIHDYASEGYEQREIFENLWEWLKFVVNEMIEFEENEEQF